MLPEPLDPKSVLPWESAYKPNAAENDLPGLSVVLPIFNAGKYLERTIRSVLCNDLKGVELIVMDGGSTDNTGEILAHYDQYFAVCISEKDRGQSEAINKGFSRATQPVLHWLNGDDVILPNTLVQVRKIFRDHPASQVVVGDAYMSEADLAPIRHFRFSDEKLRFSHLLDYAKNHLVQPSVFFTRAAWESCGPVAEDLHYAMDANLFLKMARKYRFIHLPVDIAHSVYHEDCKTRERRGESIAELGLVQAKYGGFQEARRTLNLLVDLFNDLKHNAEAVSSGSTESRSCTRCRILELKLAALKSQLAANRKLLLDLDLESN